MLYRHSDYQESYVHVCDDAHKYEKKYIKERPRIVVHDVRAAMKINHKYYDIKYCPYCGKELDSDERTNEYYHF